MRTTVVVAEDDPLTRMDIVEILKEANYEIIGEASDGIEAITLCKNKKPDIVLLDIKMPLMTGLDVSKILKEDEVEVCTILLTAYNIEKYIELANRNHVMGYLLKPIAENYFLSHLKLIYKNYTKMKKLKIEVDKNKNQLESRKVIEKAKGIVRYSNGISEEEAYSELRTLSMKKRITMRKLCDSIVRAGEYE